MRVAQLKILADSISSCSRHSCFKLSIGTIGYRRADAIANPGRGLAFPLRVRAVSPLFAKAVIECQPVGVKQSVQIHVTRGIICPYVIRRSPRQFATGTIPAAAVAKTTTFAATVTAAEA